VTQPSGQTGGGFDEMAEARAAASGDEEALSRLLERFGPTVRERLKGKIGETWRASIDEDDVMQVTYMEAFLRIERFKPRGEGAFVAWLSQVAENNLRDALRGLQAAKRPNPKDRVGQGGGASDESYAALVELIGTSEATPSRAAAKSEYGELIEQALGTLPPDYERVVRKCDLEGRPAADVAAELGRSAGAVYMLRARAHERLADALGAASKFFTDPGR